MRSACSFLFTSVVFSGPFVPVCTVSTILVFAAPNSTAKRPEVRRTVRVDVRRQTFSAPVRVQCRLYNSSCIQPLERTISSMTGRYTLLYVQSFSFVYMSSSYCMVDRTCSAYPDRSSVGRKRRSYFLFCGVLQPSDDALRYLRLVWWCWWWSFGHSIIRKTDINFTAHVHYSLVIIWWYIVA